MVTSDTYIYCENNAWTVTSTLHVVAINSVLCIKDDVAQY